MEHHPGATNGTHTLTAVAHDAAGNTATSSVVQVTVNNPDTQAPTVSLSPPPANGAIVSGTVSLTANASDNVAVTKVRFMDGTQLLAEDPSSPYSVSWNTTQVANGPHQLSAVAYDAAGNTTTSSPVNVTVANLLPRHQTVISADPIIGEVRGSVSTGGMV